MPIVRQCLSCKRQLKVPDGVGGKVRCPQCGAPISLDPIAAPAPGQPVPDWFAEMLDSPAAPARDGTNGATAVAAPVGATAEAPVEFKAIQPFEDDAPPEPWYYQFLRVVVLTLTLLQGIFGVLYGGVSGFASSTLHPALGIVVGVGFASLIILVALAEYAFTLVFLEFFSNVRAIRYRRWR